MYECSAVNTNGGTKAQGQLTVKGKLIFCKLSVTCTIDLYFQNKFEEILV